MDWGSGDAKAEREGSGLACNWGATAHMRRFIFLVLCALTIHGCNHERLSKTRESCARTADCALGLRCIKLTCVDVEERARRARFEIERKRMLEDSRGCRKIVTVCNKFRDCITKGDECTVQRSRRPASREDSTKTDEPRATKAATPGAEERGDEATRAGASLRSAPPEDAQPGEEKKSEAAVPGETTAGADAPPREAPAQVNGPEGKKTSR